MAQKNMANSDTKTEDSSDNLRRILFRVSGSIFATALVLNAFIGLLTGLSIFTKILIAIIAASGIVWAFTSD